MKQERNIWLGAFSIAVFWLAARTLMVMAWWKFGEFITSDVAYYFNSMQDPSGTALVEYPTPILWLMRMIHLISGDNFDLFFNLFVTLMVVLDALVTAYLFWRASPLAACYWIVFLALLGPILWFRIDLIPAVCVTIGLVELQRHPIFSGTMLALGAAAKLWPVLLILPLCGLGKSAQKRLASFAVTGGTLAALSLLFDGWSRSISPIIWQLQRGLQIESLSATWLMIKHATTPMVVTVEMSPFNAYELYGAGVAKWQSVASGLTVGAVVLVVVLTWLVAVVPNRYRLVSRAGRLKLSQAGLLAATAIIASMIAANKTFSPQYLIWLAGPLGLILAWARTPQEKRNATVVSLLGLIIAGMTQLVFPVLYLGLLPNPVGELGVTSLLVARNVVMAALTITLAVLAIQAACQVLSDSQIRSRRQ